jgi:hypothetical protein
VLEGVNLRDNKTLQNILTLFSEVMAGVMTIKSDTLPGFLKYIFSTI